ncbi:hypothetical protein TIFTF001_007609 [Ficus carica]|uniref:Uncharacterized protein n=1 Tax=Ficus carica TaxID=3494 RepID=A0AA87ZRJ2_FICCA|nr:hypothetical protein TIFTF001_007609 [Ficus carica]
MRNGIKGVFGQVNVVSFAAKAVVYHCHHHFVIRFAWISAASVISIQALDSVLLSTYSSVSVQFFACSGYQKAVVSFSETR